MTKTQKRAKRPPMGGTKKVTVSLRASHFAFMSEVAAATHGGNLSGALAELIDHEEKLRAMDRLLSELPPVTAAEIATIEEELRAPLPASPRRPRVEKPSRRRKTAA